MATVAEAVVKLSAETANFRRDFQQAREETKSFQSSLLDLGNEIKTAAAEFVSFEAAKELLDQVMEKTMDLEKANARLGAVLHATGNSALLSMGQIGALAEELDKTTLFTDEDIRNAAAELATFGHVHGETFTRAIKLSADLATVLGTDLTTATMRFGKMLDEPLQSIGSLSRAGVVFTMVEKEHIKTLLEHNQLAEAQAIVLDKVAHKVEGAAERVGQTGLTGEVNKLNKAWKEAMETLGSSKENDDAMSFVGGLKETIKATAEELRGLIHLLAPEDAHAMEALTEELAKQQAIVAKADQPNHSRRDVVNAADAQVRIDAITKEIAALKAYEAALEQAHAHAQGPTGETSEAAKAREEAAKKALAELTKIKKEYWAGVIKDDKAAAEAEVSITKWLDEQHKKNAEADTKRAEEKHKDAEKELAWQAQLAQMRYDEEVKQADEVQKVWTHAVQKISDDFAHTFSDLLTGQIKSFKDFAAAILSIWAKTLAQMAGAKLATSLFGGLLSAGGSTTIGSVPGFPGLDIPNPLGSSGQTNHVTVNIMQPNATAAQINGAVLGALNGRGMAAAVSRRLGP